MRISIIGGGAMAEAIITGLINGNVLEPCNINVGEPLSQRQTYLIDTYQVNCFSNNIDAVKSTNLVIFAVKPQGVSYVLEELKGQLISDQIVLSIVAGVKTKQMREALCHDLIVRVMPNAPARISKGMSVWIATPEIKSQDLETIGELLGVLGQEIRVEDEKILDMATAVSGSGPAYVWLFLEALIDGGVYIGLTRDLASKLAIQTLLGSAEMAQQYQLVLPPSLFHPGLGKLHQLLYRT
ncbi:pyrroline-5-carboxylate reductase [SAR202 cluster bacterium AD-802-E10_MRT_200m]|nr:pyrroline-5-carboxylate reductase [SAR202 cluster bacterium AD-802-E10_MRT_200m]